MPSSSFKRLKPHKSKLLYLTRKTPSLKKKKEVLNQTSILINNVSKSVCYLNTLYLRVDSCLTAGTWMWRHYVSQGHRTIHFDPILHAEERTKCADSFNGQMSNESKRLSPMYIPEEKESSKEDKPTNRPRPKLKRQFAVSDSWTH